MSSSLHVRGCAIDVSSLKKRLTLGAYSQRYFKIPIIPEEEKICDIPEKTPLKKKKMGSSRVQVKEKRLQEILYGEKQIPKKKTRQKLPLPVSSNVYPTYQILADLYKSQKKSLEEMKLTLVVPFDYEKAQHSMFDMTLLLPYMSEAYQNLYKQHMDNLKEIIKTTSDADEVNMEEDMEKKVLQIKGIMETEKSIDSEYEYETSYKSRNANF